MTEPAQPDPPPPPLTQTPEYQAALGRFVSAFAGVEGMVSAVLAREAGVTHEVAQAVFSGVRVDAAIDHIKRLCQLRHPELENPPFEAIAPPEVASCLPRISPINKLRNNILHYGVLVDEHGLPYTFNVRTPIPGKPRITEPVTIPTLDDMTADLIKIETTLLVYLIGNATPPGLVEKYYGEVLRSTWRYTSPQPSSTGRKTPGIHQGRKRRPPTSPE